MKVTNRITKFLNRNNPETIADEIAQVYHEKKDNGEEHPMDDTVEEIMQIFKDNPNPEKVRGILKSILEKKDIPNRIFEKAATKISKDEEIPDSVITDVVKDSETNIPDESINRIIEEGNVDVAERINLMQTVEDNKIIEENIKNELKILYKVCKEKKDYEVVDRVNKLKELVNGNQLNEDIQDLIRQVVAKKMAENYYSDIKRGTRIYDLSKIMSIDDMIEYDLPTMVEQEYKRIEENQKKKEGRFNKKELKEQILVEMGKDIAYKYDETGVFIIPQSENMKKIDREEEEKFIKSIQTYSRKQLSKQEILDIDEQIKGNSNNIQIKENVLINLIKKIPERDKNRSIDILAEIASNKEVLETLSMMKEKGLIDKLNKIPKEKREKVIGVMEKTIEKNRNLTIVRSPKIKEQKLNMHPKEREDR